MPKLRIDWTKCPAELVEGLREIETDRPRAFTQSTRSQTVAFTHDPSPPRPGFSIAHQKRTANVRYSRKCDAFRALGHLLGQADGASQDVTQTCQFDLMGVKFDCSRGGVPRIEMLKALFRHIALLGYNCYAPYMEDIYEIPGGAVFSGTHARDRYTQVELKAIDDYAFALGIEVFGSIRHRWGAHRADSPVAGSMPIFAICRIVFLADHEPTYEFIEKMLVAVTGVLRSSRLFIGTDEAHGLGTGRYRPAQGIQTSL